MMASRSFVFCAVILLVAQIQAFDEELSGPNVCLKQEMVASDEMVPVREPTQVATKTWCFSIPPRCETFKTVYKVVYKKQTKQTPEMVKRCCDGYIVHSNKTCIPHCMNQCINGLCVAPNKCVCNIGYSGDTCTQKCPTDKWGPNCNNACQCLNNATCDSVTGKCQCGDGWQGDSCQTPCSADRYGYLCLQECRCKNGGACDQQTGACRCREGLCGPLCESVCDEKSGRVCDKCQNGGKCIGSVDQSKCICPAGWMGEVCANPCDDGYWGDKCNNTCKICHNNGVCNPVVGSCKCSDGFWGTQCEAQCEPGKFGSGCLQTCDCGEHAQSCNPTTGKCMCYKGYKGPHCENRACPEGLFGQMCDKSCTCSNLTTCHPIDGSCICKRNWRTGDAASCSMCCMLSNAGPDCFKDCGVMDQKWICGPELSGCVCLPDYTGPGCRPMDDIVNSLPLRTAGGSTPANNTGLIVGLCIAVFVVLIILALALFYRRRVRKLQNELASVTYSSSGTDTDSQVSGADNMLYLNNDSSPIASVGGKTATSVMFKNGETFVKVAEPLPKKPSGNMYVSMPNQQYPEDTRDTIYQSIDYEEPVRRHQYASIEEASHGLTNRAFENQLYNQKPLSFAPPSYESVITETMSSTHPNKE